MRYGLLLPLPTLISCDEGKPKNIHELAVKNDREYKLKKEAQSKASEGNGFYGARLMGDSTIAFAHERRDCPAHVDNLNEKGLKSREGKIIRDKMYEEVELALRNGKFADARDFFYNPSFCPTCVP